MRAAEDGLTVTTLAERPDLTEAAAALIERHWPAFILAGEVSARLAPRLATDLADYQPLVLGEGGELLGVGLSTPLHRPPGEGLPAGWDAVLEQAMADLDAGRAPTVSCALSATLDAAHQGRRLSPLLIQAMKNIAAARGLGELLAPVRPNRKSSYPLIPMERYARWRTPGGAPFDPWMRTHWRGGAEILEVAPASMVVKGSVVDWERWSGLRMPDGGTYVVPGALVPVDVDVDADLGTYVEPNVWMRHRTGTPWAHRPDPG